MRTLLRLLPIAFALTACGRGDTAFKVNDDPSKRAADDMHIVTRTGEMVLGVRGDSVRMRLSDSGRKAASAEIRKSTADSSGGMVAWISEQVGTVVQKGIGLEVSAAITGIESVSAKDSAVTIVMKGGAGIRFFGVGGKSDGRIGGFTPADAEKFVAYLSPRLTK